MTKRVLSLLLALIMALSLCVPAFAADEPEVSADEPATAAVDEPAAAIVEGLDPDLASALNAAIAAAQAKKADVDNGEFTPETTGAYTTALDAAQAIVDKIADVAGHYVNDTDVKTATSNLNNAVKALDNKPTEGQKFRLAHIPQQINSTGAGGGQQYAVLDNMTAEEIIEALSNPEFRFYTGNASTHENAHQPAFGAQIVAAIQNALAVKKAIDAETATYKQCKDALDALEACRKNGADEKASLLATFADSSALKAAISEYEDAVEAAGVELKSDAKTAAESAIAAAKAMLGYADNGFADKAETLTDVLKALDSLDPDLEESLIPYSAYISSAIVHDDPDETADPDNPDLFDYNSVKVWITVADKTDDVHKYYLTYSINGAAAVTYADDNGTILFDKDTAANHPGSYEIKKLALKNNNTVTLTLHGGVYDAQTKKFLTDNVVSTFTVTVNTSYNGPKIIQAGYAPLNADKPTGIGGTADGVMYVRLDQAASSSAANTKITYEKVRFIFTDPNNKTYTYDPTDYTKQVYSLGMDGTNDVKTALGLTAGAWTVQLEVFVKDSAHENGDWFKTPSIVSFEVAGIDSYKGKADATGKTFGTGYPQLLAAIEACEGYTDLYTEDKSAPEDMRIALAQANEYVGGADTKPNDKANREKVDDLIMTLQTVYAKFAKMVDYSALNALIEQADKLVSSDYTAVSWSAWLKNTALADAKKLVEAKLPDNTANQGKVENAVKALEKALKDLVALDVPETAMKDLTDLIKDAEAIIDDEASVEAYTEESLAALEVAVEAAKKVAEAKDPTISAVAEVTAALQAAVKGLTPVEPEHADGWNLDGSTWYYYKNNEIQKSQWIGSKGLWYYVDEEGKMLTGFQYIEDAKWGNGWFYLEPSNAKGTQGRMRTGWQDINDASAGAYGWFETRSNGHQGACTYTKGWGDFVNYMPVKK